MRTEIYTKVILTIIATTLVVIVVKPFIASRNAENINEREILADVGKDIAAVAEKSNADENKEADRQREERTHPYSTATSSQPPRNEPQPAPLPKSAPAAAPTDPYAVADKIVTDHVQASEDHGMIASIRGGPSIPGVDNNLPPLSQTLGPVVKSAERILPVPLIVMSRVDVAQARSNPRHEGHHFDNAPITRAFVSLDISPVQAVLGRDGQPITGTGPHGESITLIQVADGRGIDGYVPSNAFAKLK